MLAEAEAFASDVQAHSAGRPQPHVSPIVMPSISVGGDDESDEGENSPGGASRAAAARSIMRRVAGESDRSILHDLSERNASENGSAMASRDSQPSSPSDQQLERDLSAGGAGFLGSQQPRMVSYVTALFHLCKNNC